MNGLFGTGQVTLSDSDNDFVDPAPWSKSKEKRQDNTVETRNVKRKLVLKVNHLAKTKKKKRKTRAHIDSLMMYLNPLLITVFV